jgi:hypothetical protein
MARTTGLVLAVAACLGLAACGGGDTSKTTDTTAQRTTDADRVVAAAQAYTAALVDGDYEQACRRLTPEARRRMTDAAGATGANGCPGLFRGLFGEVNASDRGGASDVRVKLVSITDDRARVRTTVEGQTDTLALDRVGEAWLVDAQL